MAISLRHTFQSLKGNSPDATLIQPSHWNSEHQLTLGGQKLLGRGDAGSGVAEEISVGTGLTLSPSRVLSTVADTMNTARMIGRWDAGVGAKQEVQVGRGLELTSTGFLRTKSDVLPIGIMLDFAGNTPPLAWALCSGQVLSRAIYADLAALITTIYGPYCDEDGLQTNEDFFRLPDLRARATVGRDVADHQSKFANRITNSGDGSSGINARTVGGYTVDTWGIPATPPAPIAGIAGSEKSALTNANQIPVHGHTYRTSNQNGNVLGNGGGFTTYNHASISKTNHPAFAGVPTDNEAQLIGGNMAPATVPKPFNVLPPVMVVNKIIYHGVYT